MQKVSSKKTFIIIAILVVVAVGAYFYFSGVPNDDATSSIEAEATPEEQESLAAAARIIALLNQVNDIDIDPKFFESTVFKSLVDNTVRVPEQNVGRENPFVPVPGTFITPAPAAGSSR